MLSTSGLGAVIPFGYIVSGENWKTTNGITNLYQAGSDTYDVPSGIVRLEGQTVNVNEDAVVDLDGGARLDTNGHPDLAVPKMCCRRKWRNPKTRLPFCHSTVIVLRPMMTGFIRVGTVFKSEIVLP